MPQRVPWFNHLFGFDELRPPGGRVRSPALVSEQFEVVCGDDDTVIVDDVTVWPRDLSRRGAVLRSLANGRSWSIGHFSVVPVSQLRDTLRAGNRPSAAAAGAAGSAAAGSTRHSHIAVGDVLELHALHPGATFQAASQMNALEFPNARTVPESGISGYASDPTQGPACALACAAGTLFRNYFARVGPGRPRGQSRDNQINMLDGLETMLGVDATRGGKQQLWRVENGYTAASPAGLAEATRRIESHPMGREALVDAVRVGLHARCEVCFTSRFTIPTTNPTTTVTQVYAAAPSVAYSGTNARHWETLARVVLDGMYEGTLLAAAVDKAAGHGSGVVFLTQVGMGVFGNREEWVADATARAIHRARDLDLDVRICHYRKVNETFRARVETTLARLGGA